MNIIKKMIPNSIKKKIKNKLTIYDADKTYEIIKKNEPELKGKTAVVTGGSGAIGRAIAFRLAAEGAKVYVAGRTKETIEKVVKEIKGVGLKAEAFILDVSNETSVENAFDNLFATENLDILINCAGGGARDKMSSLDQQSVEVIDNILNTNLRGTMLCTRKAAQNMRKHKSGKIVIISSAVGVQGKENYSEYAAAKSGMFGFTKSMALELGKFGINVNCVTPGFIQRGKFNTNTLEYLKSTNCLRKVGTLEDVANAVYFMVSAQSDFVTGQNLCIDGGRTLGLMGDN